MIGAFGSETLLSEANSRKPGGHGAERALETADSARAADAWAAPRWSVLHCDQLDRTWRWRLSWVSHRQALSAQHSRTTAPSFTH